MATVSLGIVCIEVPDGMEWELQNLIEDYKPAANDTDTRHPFEEMEEEELRFLVADNLDIGVGHVDVWPQIQISPGE